jgi:hypothetical protein
MWVIVKTMDGQQDEFYQGSMRRFSTEYPDAIKYKTQDPALVVIAALRTFYLERPGPWPKFKLRAV